MVTPVSPPHELLQTVQSLVQYYAPNMQTSVARVAGCFAAGVLGLVVAFRSRQVARGLVCLAGIGAGAAAGYRIGLAFGGPGPISAGIGAVVLGAIAWRTYRLWLAIGTVAAITLSATAYQMAAQGNLSSLLRELQSGQHSAGTRSEKR